jgi:hypothetical protein
MRRADACGGATDGVFDVLSMKGTRVDLRTQEVLPKALL